MSLWRPRLEYFSLTRLISAYSRRTFRVVPGQLEAFEGSWPPLLQDPGSGCGSLWVWLWLWLAVGVLWLWLWLWLAVAGCRSLWLWPRSWLWLWLDVAGDGASWACGCCT